MVTTTTTPEVRKPGEGKGNGKLDRDEVDKLIAQLMAGETLLPEQMGKLPLRDGGLFVDPVRQDSPGSWGLSQPRIYGGKMTINEALAELRRLPKAQIEKLQRMLFDAQYYDSGYYEKATPTPVNWGSVDAGTLVALHRLMNDAVLSQHQSLTDILNARIRSANQSGQLGGGGVDFRQGVVSGGRVNVIQLSDPAELRAFADKLGRAILGEKPSPELRDRLVKMIRDEQLAQQKKVADAETAKDREVHNVRVAGAEAEIAAENRSAGGGGEIISPTPFGGKVDSTLGAPRDGGRTHKGADFFAPKGSAAVAPIAGEVVKAGDGGSKSGLRVWIKDDQGRFHFLAHLDSVTVKAGQRVTKGQSIGTVGNTGNAKNTPAHVHYSINSSPNGEDAILDPAKVVTYPGQVENRDGADPSQPKVEGGEHTFIEPTTVVQDLVNEEARMEEEIRRANPTLASAHDLGTVMDGFVAFITGGQMGGVNG